MLAVEVEKRDGSSGWDAKASEMKARGSAVSIGLNGVGKKLISVVASAALVVSLAPATALANVGDVAENAGVMRQVVSMAAEAGNGGARKVVEGNLAASSLTRQMTPQANGLAKAKLPKKKVRALYKKVLDQAVKGKGVFARQYSSEVKNASDKKYWKSGVRYSILDVDKNGTPELLVRAGSITASMRSYVFTVSSKKANHLGQFIWGTFMYGKGSGFYVWNQRMGYRWMNLVTILYGKVRQQTVVSDSGEAKRYPLYRAFVKKYKLKNLKASPATKYALLKSKIK